MPAHSVLISPAQGLPACCATAAEPDSSIAVNITSPDRIPVILGSSAKFRGRIGQYPKAGRAARKTPLGRYKRFVNMAQSVARKGGAFRRQRFKAFQHRGILSRHAGPALIAAG